MKRIITLVAMMVFTCIVFSQDYVPTKADLDRFYKTKTLIVLEENPLLEYNLIIKEVLQREWKLTKYDFITYPEYEKTYRLDPKYSFLVMTDVTFANDKTEAKYKFLHVMLGGDHLLINDMPTICSVPLAYSGVEEESYIYKLSSLLRFMQDHIASIYANPDLISSNIFKHYNENMQDIKQKTMYVVKEELSPEVNSAAKIKKVYPFKVKIATREEIEQRIVARDPDCVFLHKVGPEGTHLTARCYKIVIGAADSKFYYFDYHMVSDKRPDGILESDFKQMAKD